MEVEPESNHNDKEISFSIVASFTYSSHKVQIEWRIKEEVMQHDMKRHNSSQTNQWFSIGFVFCIRNFCQRDILHNFTRILQHIILQKKCSAENLLFKDHYHQLEPFEN